MFITLENVFYQVPNSKIIYEDLSLNIDQGDFLGVLGKNGAGKTTLIDLLMGHRPITKGYLRVLGEDPMSFHRKNKQNIFVLTHDMQVQKSHTIQNYLDFTGFFYDKYNKFLEKRLIKYFNLDASEKMGALSTGQKVKAQLVAAFASEAQLLIFDEVTAVLDPESRMLFFKILKGIKSKRSKTVILATNIAEDLNNIFETVLFIDDTKAQLHHVESLGYLFNLEESA